MELHESAMINEEGTVRMECRSSSVVTSAGTTPAPSLFGSHTATTSLYRKVLSLVLLCVCSSLLAQNAKAAPPAPPAQNATARIRNAALRTKAISTTALTVASSSGSQGTAVTLMATVDGPTGAAPGGSVAFTVEGKQVGEAPMNHGVASFTVNDLPSGKCSLSAVYKGDDNHLPSKSLTIHYYRDADE